MSNLKDFFKKKGFITALVLDLAGIICSFLINTNLTNIFLARIALFFYCIRFELIALLVVLIIGYVYYYLFKTYYVTCKKALYFILIIPIVISLAVSYRPLRQLVIARYYYFNNNYYIEESQYYFLSKTSDYINKREWDKSIKYLNLAKEVYPDAYNIDKIDESITNTNLCLIFCQQLYNSYIKPNKNHITRNTYECAKVLYKLNPSQYDNLYNSYNDSIKIALDAYPLLYDSYNSGNYNDCRELILKYGWFWFEPTVNEIFTYDNEGYVMSHLKDYLSNEDPISAQQRLLRAWMIEDSFTSYIQH